MGDTSLNGAVVIEDGRSTRGQGDKHLNDVVDVGVELL